MLIDGSWGEQIAVTPDNTLELAMVWLDLTTEQARGAWEPFTSGLQSDGVATVALEFESHQFRDLWSAAYWQRVDPELITVDPRPNQPPGQFWWSSNQGEVAQFIFSYLSRWIPLAMFVDTPGDLVEAMHAASRLARVTLHVNKGLAGASEEVIARERMTSLNPAVLDSAAFATIGAAQGAAFPGVPGHEPDLEAGRRRAAATNAAIGIIREATPGAGTYANEADYFEPDWQQTFWGSNYDRLLAIKRKVDPDNLFRVHHGVGSE